MPELPPEEYCRHGISLAGLRHFASTNRHRISAGMTTSDVCHAVIKPLTSAPGWRCEAECVDPAPDRRWYKHRYVNDALEEERHCGVGLKDAAPAGTTSLCQLYREVSEEFLFWNFLHRK